MTTGIILWATISLFNICVAIFTYELVKMDKHLEERKSNTMHGHCCQLLENAFSFVRTVDSKMIGLLLFLTANIFTGLTNLFIDTKSVGELSALLILSLNSIVSRLLPFFFHYILTVKYKYFSKT